MALMFGIKQCSTCVARRNDILSYESLTLGLINRQLVAVLLSDSCTPHITNKHCTFFLTREKLIPYIVSANINILDMKIFIALLPMLSSH